MPVAEAKALSGKGPRHSRSVPRFEQYDPEADLQALRLLAHSCQQFSPIVGIECPDSLLLNITGCTHLFGGEQRLAELVVRNLQQRGFTVRVAVAGTIGAAWAAAHYGENLGIGMGMGGRGRGSRRATDSSQDNDLCSESGKRLGGSLALPIVLTSAEQQTQALCRLSVEALRLPDEILRTLYELDIRQIGQLRKLSRASLKSRFGMELIERIDQAFGDAPELIVPEQPPEPVEADWPFEYPTGDRRTIEVVFRRLLERMAEKLKPRQQGVQQLMCRLQYTDGQPDCFSVGLVHPSLSVDHLFELVHVKLERVHFASEVTNVFLRAESTGPLTSQQQEIIDTGLHHQGWRELSVLIDRMSNRLGQDSVLRPRLCAEAQPEYAVRLEPVIAVKVRSFNGKPEATAFVKNSRLRLAVKRPRPVPRFAALNRPTRLKAQPVPIEVMAVVPEGPPIRFRWKNRQHTVVRCWGPERIETGWWRGRENRLTSRGLIVRNAESSNQHQIPEEPSRTNTPYVRSQQARRDYYRVETDSGHWFWLFRRIGEETWFLHGVFD